MTPQRTRAFLVLLCLALIAPALTACASDGPSANNGLSREAARRTQGTTRATRRQASRPSGQAAAARTSDTGSRYIDTARPVGAIAVETSPISGGALILPYAAGPLASGSETPVRHRTPTQAGGTLPAPGTPPRGRIPPPPQPPNWP